MKKVYVNDANQTTIICPKCGFEKNVDVSDFKDIKKGLKPNVNLDKSIGSPLNFERNILRMGGCPENTLSRKQKKTER